MIATGPGDWLSAGDEIARRSLAPRIGGIPLFGTIGKGSRCGSTVGGVSVRSAGLAAWAGG